MASSTPPASEQPSERRFNVQLPDSYATYVNRWALVVGVSNYQHQTLNLKYADRDADAFYDLLLSPTGGDFEPDHVVKLTNEMATTGNITRSLRSFLKKPAREDLVIIYFACHGSPDLDRPENIYLITHDTVPDDISGTALPMREIDLSLRENLLAERVIIFADTCHSAAIGGGIGRRSIADSTTLVNRYLKEVSLTRGGVALLTSAEANEVSFEDARWGGGHGVFTHFLLEGMRGGADRNQNGFVTVGELFEYVRENVQRATDYKQHPSIGTNPFDRNLPLAITFTTGGQQAVTDNSTRSSQPDPNTFSSAQSRDSSSAQSRDSSSALETGKIVHPNSNGKVVLITTALSVSIVTAIIAISITRPPSNLEQPPTDNSSLIAGTPDNSSPLSSVSVVRYYPQGDGAIVRTALQSLDLNVEIGISNQLPIPYTNSIWFGSQVELQDVKRIAQTLVEADVPIRAIRPFRDPSTKTSIIEIGADRSLAGRTVLTVEEIRNATSFAR